MKSLIVYWSGTGNTEEMAQAVYEGAKEAGGDIRICNVAQAGDVSGYDVLLLGCPAMGAEQLESEEFEPFFSSIEGQINGKKIGLFGSYDWGDGEWMRIWQERVENAGGIMIADGIIANNTPDVQALEACKSLGKSAVS